MQSKLSYFSQLMLSAGLFLLLFFLFYAGFFGKQPQLAATNYSFMVFIPIITAILHGRASHTQQWQQRVLFLLPFLTATIATWVLTENRSETATGSAILIWVTCCLLATPAVEYVIQRLFRDPDFSLTACISR